jgi:cyanate permease
MENTVNRSRLFIGSCFALITTAMAFGIRAGIMNDISNEFGLSDSQLAIMTFMGTFGFPVATLVGGPLYNILGSKKLAWVAFFCHFCGILFSVLASNYTLLFLSTFLVSFANGMVEAALNPLIAQMYDSKDTTKMMNRFHVWFPGGIAISALLGYLFKELGFVWQLKIAFMFIPTFIYGYLFWGQTFPKNEGPISTSNSENIKAIFTSPLYLFIVACMCLTATTELGTQSWVERILDNAGANPLIILALITGVMAICRLFAGDLVHKLSIPGVLFISAVLATVSLVILSTATGATVYIGAFLFALGVCYFWPNLISFVAVYLPKTGAFGMSLIGGIGMLSVSLFQPIIGGWLESSKIESAKANGIALPDGIGGKDLVEALKAVPEDLMKKIETAAGQATLDNMAVLPAILIVAFGVLYFWVRKKEVTQ